MVFFKKYFHDDNFQPPKIMHQMNITNKTILNDAKEIFGESFCFREHQLQAVKSIVENCINEVNFFPFCFLKNVSGKTIKNVLLIWYLSKTFKFPIFIEIKLI